MADELPRFTIDPTTKFTDVIGDVIASELSEEAMTSAHLVFTCNIVEKFVVWKGDVKRIGAVTAYVNTAGTIERQYKSGGAGPVMLLANDPGLNVSNVQWTVEIKVNRTVIKSWTFTAPGDGAVHKLPVSMPPPEQRTARGPDAVNIGSIVFNAESQLVVTLEDGAVLPPLTIPPGTIAMVRNGDGTVTVGP